MEAQSQIRTFIDCLFENKPEEKRIQWSQLFIDQELDTLDDIKELSDESWKNLTINLPLKIRQTIQKKLRIKQKSPQTSTDLSCDTKNVDVNKIEHSSNIIHISENDITKIILLMNKQVSPEDIVKMLDATLGTPRGDAIFERIKLLTRPPKPQPTNSKLISQQTKDMLPLFHYQEKEDVLRKYYTFIVIGQTGSGKTTLLDAFVNMLTGMEYIDNWRWKLVDERDIVEKNKNVIGASKTAKITTYYINDCQNKFNIRIIDTPGFGDTSGIKVDDQITEKFLELFTELPEIDYIILTIKASQTRLKPGSKYVYEKVQQLFGANAKDRFIIMCTFADDSTPQCLQAISKDIIYQKYFKFNNSAIYAPSYKEGSSTKLYWKMAMNSVRQFTQYVISKDRLPMSLAQSSEVLETRKYICTSIHSSQQYLKQSWKQLENAKNNYKSLSENQDKIEKNGKYTDKIPKIRITKKPLPNVYQMCVACQMTCCQVCVWPSSSSQSACTYFSGGRNCPICPGKCPRHLHDKAAFLLITQKWEQQVIVDFKKKMFDQGLSGAQLYGKILGQKIQQIDNLANTIWNLSNEIKQNLKKLEQIALKPKLFTDKDFYLQMIKQQEDLREDGWVERVGALNDVLKKIQDLKIIQTILSIDDLFPDLRQLKQNFESIEQKKKHFESIEQAKRNSNCQIY